MVPTSLTISETAELLDRGEITSLQVTEAYLTRIEKLNPVLGAYLTVLEDSARLQAKASDERRAGGKSLGELDGIPLAIKDNFSTKGQRTTAGSKILERYQPLYDATVVAKLKAAGAVILGKTNLDEFAMGSSTENSAYGASKNPWDHSRVPGGSSGGSAVAVAADLCAGALGSDTGGSIRQPASLCGVVGLKPTYGRVSRYGLIAMASSLDQIGPLTKSVEDAELLFELIRGQDRFDSTTLPSSSTGQRKDRGFGIPDQVGNDIKNLKIGVPKEYFGEGMDVEVELLVKAAITELEKLGASIVEVSLPTSPLALAAYYIICPVEVASNMARYDGIRYGESLYQGDEKYGLTEIYKKTRAKYLGSEVKRRIMLGTYASSAGYYEAYYNKAMQVRSLIKKEFDAVFSQVNCLAAPVSPTVAFKLGERTDDPLAMYLADVNTVPINIAGVPAVSLPCGFIKELPVGLQLIGPHLGEAVLFTLARAYEQATDWHRRKPSVS